MVKMVSVDTMRRSDAWTIAHKTPSLELMRRAGEGIFREGLKAGLWQEPVAIVCGKGNNAGDGYVVADLMFKNNIRCELLLISDRFSEDGRHYFDICMNDGIPVRKLYEEDEFDFSAYGSVLDCLLGTGFKGSVDGIMKAVIDAINCSGAKVVSADINSGLNGDTGLGETYVRSDLTVSIGDFKYGHFKGNADIAMKNKVNIDIGIEIIE